MAGRFTVFDVMEARGEFKKNAANVGSQGPDGAALYSGPIQYPRMLYHPKGEERILVAGEVIATPMGPQKIMEQREIIWKIVYNAVEEEQAVKEGWHTHPAASIKAAGRKAPETGADQVIAELQKKIKDLTEQKAALERSKPINPLSKP